MVKRAPTLIAAARDGDSLELLRASLRSMAKAMSHADTPPAAKAALARELRMTQGAIDAACAGEAQGDDLDELAARREARLSG